MTYSLENKFSRRKMLKTLLGGGVATVALGSEGALKFKMSTSSAQGATGNSLIKIFMRGGIDGMHLFAPYGDPNYAALRPNIKLTPPGTDNDSCLRLDSFFGLHPAFEPLLPIWNDGNLAISPATHFQEATRSHFVNQRLIENGVTATVGGTGYINQYLDNSSHPSPIRALAAGSRSVPGSMSGDVAVPAIQIAESFAVDDSLWCCEDNGRRISDELRRVYEAEPVDAKDMEELAYEQSRTMGQKLSLIEEVLDANQANTPDYNRTSVGNGLRVFSQLTKAGVTVEVCAIDWSGSFDTHSNQKPNGIDANNMSFQYHKTLNEGAQDLALFYEDMQAFRDKVTVLVGTEFGREVAENGSHGTDHGWASAWWAFGGKVNGGFHGGWPGLATNQLQDGRFLASNVDYRDVISEVMSKHLGASQSTLSKMFPGHPYTPVGMFA